MSPEKQRIAIASLMGINISHCKAWVLDHGGYRWKHFGTLDEALKWNKIFPSEDFKTEIYTNINLLPEIDLNFIHEVEIYLSKQTNCDGGSRMPWYRHNLYNVCLDAKSPFCNPEHATSVQRAEALLKTLNLWEESETYETRNSN